MNKPLNPLKQQEVEKWLAGRKDGTTASYTSALKAYMEFTHLTPKEIIDKAEADRKKSPREQGEPELSINLFYTWLTTKYTQKVRGKGGTTKTNGKVGISESLANMYCMAIRGFYAKNGFPIDKTRINIGPPTQKQENNKLQLRREEIQKLLNVASSIRDKTLILLHYQSFQGVGEVCRLNYGQVQRGLESGEEFFPVENFRAKRRVKYHLVMGPEVIEFLKLYLSNRRRDGEVFEFDTPLFIKEAIRKGKQPRIAPHLIENMMKELALKSGLVSEKQMEVADLNPGRPHALRSSGMTVAKLAGIPEIAVEYMAGHTLNGTDAAYWQARTEELTELYKKHYVTLRILKPMVDEAKVKELETKATEMEKKVFKRDDVIDALVENGKAKEKKIQEQDTKIAELDNKIKDLTDQVQNYMATAASLLKTLEDSHLFEPLSNTPSGHQFTKEDVEKILDRQQKKRNDPADST